MLMVGEIEQRRRFAYALHAAMAHRDMSARALAQKLKVDPRRISRWLQQKDLPNLYESQALAEALGVEERLFKDPPEPPPPPPEPHYPLEEYLLGGVDEGATRGLSPKRRGSAAGHEPAPSPPQRQSSTGQ